MNPKRIYELSFVTVRNSKKQVPEIVISIPQEYFCEYRKYIGNVVTEGANRATRYLTDASAVPFALGARGRYGYAGCCVLEEANTVCNLRFEMFDFQSRELAYTFHVSLLALDMLSKALGKRQDSTALQRLDLYTYCDEKGQSHRLGGTIFPVFGQWLENISNYALQSGEDSDSKLLESVVERRVMDSMNEALHHLHPKVGHGENPVADILAGGRFFLGCGAAGSEEISIFLDRLSNRSMRNEACYFNSHNVRSPEHQLTLLAGLACLVGLAIEDEKCSLDLQEQEVVCH